MAKIRRVEESALLEDVKSIIKDFEEDFSISLEWKESTNGGETYFKPNGRSVNTDTQGNIRGYNRWEPSKIEWKHFIEIKISRENNQLHSNILGNTPFSINCYDTDLFDLLYKINENILKRVKDLDDQIKTGFNFMSPGSGMDRELKIIIGIP